MELNRALAGIDRRILAGLDHNEQSQMVRMPVSEVVWSTWRRHCTALGVAMGRGVAHLIAHELGIVVARPPGVEPRSLVICGSGSWYLSRTSMSAKGAWMIGSGRCEHLSVGYGHEEAHWRRRPTRRSVGTSLARVVRASSTNDVTAADPAVEAVCVPRWSPTSGRAESSLDVSGWHGSRTSCGPREVGGWVACAPETVVILLRAR